MQNSLGLADGEQDILVLHDGTTMQTHGPAQCLGEHCAIHNPSDHPLKDAPLTWLRDLKIMMRLCSHNALHPDPDVQDFEMVMAMAGLRTGYYDGWHPCCDEVCCLPPHERGPFLHTYSPE